MIKPSSLKKGEPCYKIIARITLDAFKDIESSFSESPNLRSLLSILAPLESVTRIVLASNSGRSLNVIDILSGIDAVEFTI